MIIDVCEDCRGLRGTNGEHVCDRRHPQGELAKLRQELTQAREQVAHVEAQRDEANASAGEEALEKSREETALARAELIATREDFHAEAKRGSAHGEKDTMRPRRGAWLSWTLHNCIGHPAMGLLRLVGLWRLANWAHDVTMPTGDR